MFEKASRIGLRFETAKGLLTVEDLWRLPLTSTRADRPNLDDIAVGLFRQLKESDTESFVKKAAKKDDTAQLAFDIVKHIIDIRIAEDEAAAVQRANKEKKRRILEIIAQKEDEQLAGASLDELKAMAESL